MPAKSPDAVKRKYKRAQERYKERWKSDPEFRKTENRRRYLAKKKRLEAQFIGPPKPKKEKHPFEKWFHGLRSGAAKRGIDFELTIDDLYLPEVCPILGIELKVGKGSPSRNSPTVDRIDNSKGYTKDNIWVISMRANSLKSDASFEEIEKLYFALKSKRL